MFHPEDRISVEAALEHSYLKDFHGQMEEPVCKELFDFDFERGTTSNMESTSKDVMSREEVRLRIFDEVLKYRPAAAAAVQDTLHPMDADAKCGDRRLSNAKADFDSKTLDTKVGEEDMDMEL